MAEKYQKSTAEIAAGCILSVITAYNIITALLTPAPVYVSQCAHQQLEERLKSSESKLKEALEIDPTQMDGFDTLIGN